MPRPVRDCFGADTDVVHSGTQTPPTLPQPVQPLLVMHTHPSAQSDEALHEGTSSQNSFCPQTAVPSVVVKQNEPPTPPQGLHSLKPTLQFPPVTHVWQSFADPDGVRQQPDALTFAPHGGMQTGPPQHVDAEHV
jgi:hypothetical protein